MVKSSRHTILYNFDQFTSVTVTHLTKISVHHFAQKPVTWAKFCQVLPFVQPFQQCVSMQRLSATIAVTPSCTVDYWTVLWKLR